jgi:hypothetical protein
MCARTEKLKFDSLWEECIQEETRVANREALLARNDDQALATHPKEEGRNPTSKRRLIKSLNSQTNSIIKNLIQGDFRRKDNERKGTTHLYNAIIVTRWDTLRSFVQPDEKNTRENIRGSMPM